MARRPPGPGPDDVDADLTTATDEEIRAELEAAGSPSDELDLHAFQPSECADVVAEYLHAARAKGLPRVRIIHGKGTGTLRRIVESVLSSHPAVASFQVAGSSGGWGATAVELKPVE